MKPVKVKSLVHLKRICLRKPYEPLEFRLALNGGCYSAKTICYQEEVFLWEVHHSIDETEEVLTDEELMNDTNIGEGIEKGAFYYMKGA
jgi:hypothetical protein